MPRNYIRKTIATTPNKDNILAAIKDVRIEKKPLRAVAIARKIPASSLFRYLKKIDAAFQDVSKFKDEELMSCIEDATNFSGRPVCSILFLVFIFDYLSDFFFFIFLDFFC